MSEPIWKDRKRYFGLPISFTKYALTDDRLFCDTGLLSIKEEEILLYRIRDITFTQSIWQRIFRVGSIHVVSSDQTAPRMVVQSVKNARDVKEQLFTKVEEAKTARRMRSMELMDNADDSDFDI